MYVHVSPNKWHLKLVQVWFLWNTKGVITQMSKLFSSQRECTMVTGCQGQLQFSRVCKFKKNICSVFEQVLLQTKSNLTDFTKLLFLKHSYLCGDVLSRL